MFLLSQGGLQKLVYACLWGALFEGGFALICYCTVIFPARRNGWVYRARFGGLHLTRFCFDLLTYLL